MKGWSTHDVTRVQRKRQQQAQPSKYRAIKTTVDGITFDSAKEARRWQELKVLERAGEIANLQRQIPFGLRCPGPDGIAYEVCVYVCDFLYHVDGHVVVEDAKSVATRTAVYRLKAKWLKLQQGIDIQEV